MLLVDGLVAGFAKFLISESYLSAVRCLDSARASLRSTMQRRFCFSSLISVQFLAFSSLFLRCLRLFFGQIVFSLCSSACCHLLCKDAPVFANDTGRAVGIETQDLDYAVVFFRTPLSLSYFISCASIESISASETAPAA